MVFSRLSIAGISPSFKEVGLQVPAWLVLELNNQLYDWVGGSSQGDVSVSILFLNVPNHHVAILRMVLAKTALCEMPIPCIAQDCLLLFSPVLPLVHDGSSRYFTKIGVQHSGVQT